MSVTRPFLKTIFTVPFANRSVINKNVICGIRHFQANNVQREQSPDAESEILRQQRKLRPVSPHLTIYQPQLTWYMSSAHRLTGVALGGALYFSSMTYLCMPLLGYQVDSQVLVDHFGAAPEALKFSAKAILAAPFTYHISNGVRHLLWDAEKFLDIKDVYRTGYAVLASTVIGTLYLASL